MHIPGATNKLADAYSHFQWDYFRALAPEAERLGVSGPQRLWNIALDSRRINTGFAQSWNLDNVF